MTPAELDAALQTAQSRLNAGRAYDARTLLERTVAAAPDSAEAHRLLGLARKATRDLAGAEAALARAMTLRPDDAPAAIARAEVLALMGRTGEAEGAYRAAIDRHPQNAQARLRLSELLEPQGRASEALSATEPLAAESQDFALLSQHAYVLKRLGRKRESLEAYQRAAAVEPRSFVADHNVAAGLADLGRHAEAEAAARRALDKGGVRAPETWQVLAHSLQAQDRLDEAEAAYREAIKLRPAYLDAHKDLAQLIWVRTENGAAATAALDEALVRAPDQAGLVMAKAAVQSHAGDEAGSFDTLARLAARQPANAPLLVAAAQQAGRAGRLEDALALAERAVAAQPAENGAVMALCEALLGVGDAARAAPMIEGLRERAPNHQHVLALQATAWRMLGDERFEALYDYAAFVRPYRIDAPPGWRSLDAYLADLSEALVAMHTTRTHPVGQSLRHGSQTNQSLLHVEHPAVKAFPTAIDGPIRAHLAALGRGADPLRARNTQGYAIEGIWSVRLRPSGFHIDHVHPEGWLSSACYIALPSAVEGEGREGWIRFGEPGIPTRPPLPAQHHVKPEPGMLVLFPSYMWHGTVPFTGDERRLTVAFDLVPA